MVSSKEEKKQYTEAREKEYPDKDESVCRKECGGKEFL